MVRTLRIPPMTRSSIPAHTPSGQAGTHVARAHVGPDVAGDREPQHGRADKAMGVVPGNGRRAGEGSGTTLVEQRNGRDYRPK